MSNESCPGIHEHSNEYCCHGKWNNVDIKEVMLHDKRYKDRKNSDHCIYHGNAPWVIEIILAKQRKIQCKNEDKNGYI